MTGTGLHQVTSIAGHVTWVEVAAAIGKGNIPKFEMLGW